MKFKIGDRVKVISNYLTYRYGKIGKVVDIDPSYCTYSITVQFEDGKVSFGINQLEKIEMKAKITFSDGVEVEISKETEDNLRKAAKPHNIPERFHVGDVFEFPDGLLRMWISTNDYKNGFTCVSPSFAGWRSFTYNVTACFYKSPSEAREALVNIGGVKYLGHFGDLFERKS